MALKITQFINYQGLKEDFYSKNFSVQGLVLIFVEIPFLLKICPLSENFNTFIKKFNQNWPRAGFYLGMSVIQFLSLIPQVTSLLVPAIFLLFSAIFYAFAAFKHQQFQNSSAVISTSSDNFPTDAVVREIL
ncbi:Golgi apparatus membrane protein [Wickerhamomyces ciferrii]|uniref:Golgi apparatus membrane protein TVP18 n=1 Tax=Wickerhamomyces ciferrii (strain ATCC 14091 / BCRC 22168 / CBS 111 / JCM 3599 / NBRC 0793 / NRRL Y-1031 F-60-10) TaxID=1206466 RepID=K0KJB3_WICCF|nr:Golgi apparatus membrane protein [Wickerhamomyces ciferrii]CCH43066.1 Golgi apparatus membrane protein [Wickerhamomyces ciferrii]